MFLLVTIWRVFGIMNGRELLERIRRDDLVLSMSLRVGIGNPAIEVARREGFDFIYIYFEHGVMVIETFAEIVRKAKLNGLLTLCRVPDLNMGFVNRVLDAGASGLVFPISCRGRTL